MITLLLFIAVMSAGLLIGCAFISYDDYMRSLRLVRSMRPNYQPDTRMYHPIHNMLRGMLMIQGRIMRRYWLALSRFDVVRYRVRIWAIRKRFEK